MRLIKLAAIVVLLIGAEALAQNSRSVLTGIVYDPEGNRVQDAGVIAENSGTKIQYQAKTNAGGYYAFSELPVGKYVVSIALTGFEPYTSEPVFLPATKTVRFDIALALQKKPKAKNDDEEEEEESVYVPLMYRDDDTQWAHTISANTLDNLPLLGFDYGEGRIRNPLLGLQLAPAVLMKDREHFLLGGAPDNTGSIRIEGQETKNGILTSWTKPIQAGAEAVEEFSVQASNYAAEYGPAGGGIVNIAMKSGTTAYHGSVYTYFTNENLNEPNAYTGWKPEDRRYNYGATLGGPLSIPRIYKGDGKTFVFLNFEQLRQDNVYMKAFTVPTLAFRQGDFRKLLTGRKIGTDALGRSIMEGAIYDPSTERVVNGQRTRNQFPSNIVPKARFDSMFKLIQAYIPKPTDTDNSHITNNYVTSWNSPRLDNIGSFKLDRNFGLAKLSFYYGINVTDASESAEDGADGIENAITGAKDTYLRAQTYRLNYERLMSSTRTLHVGLGYQDLRWERNSAYGTFDANTELGLTGANLSLFPYISGLNTIRGGVKDLGADALGLYKMQRPSANASMAWIHNNHLFKVGAELNIEGYPSALQYPAYGALRFSGEQTTLPSTYGANIGGAFLGFPYASFMLGLVDSGDIGVTSQPRLGKHGWALFAQDSWKVTRKLTLEYGLRYDFQTYLRDGKGRMANFSPTAVNPGAGDLKGAMVFEGSGAGGCNCDFAKAYKNAFGPRIGVAYQMGDKTVLRAGVGVIYGQTPSDNGSTQYAGSTNPFFPTTYGNAARKLSNGFPAAGAWPNPDLNLTYIGSGITPLAIHPDAGRLPRQIQWNAGVQRELPWKMILDLAYVGNRGTGWESNGYASLNALTTSRLEDLDLDITDADDRLLLLSPLNSSLAIQKGYTAPYSGFPLTETVAQSLRPYPQYGDILYRWAPLGKTWYDSVQLKITKQISNGIAFMTGFSWQKERSAGMEGEGAIIAADSIDDSSELAASRHVSPLSRTYTFYFAPSFTFPKFKGNKYVAMALSDWQFNAVLQYASGFPIRVPNSNNGLYQLLFQTTYSKLLSKEFYLKKPDDRGVDPTNDFLLSPTAWTDPEAGQFSTTKAYYDSYRFKRHPSEQISFGRTVQINPKLRLNARIEFQNILNRKDMANPYYLNAGAVQAKDDDGLPQSGFGYIDYRALGGNPRNGQVVVRLEF